MLNKRREAVDGLRGVPRANAARWAAMHPAINDWMAAAPVLALLPPVAPIDAVFRRCAAGRYRLKAAMAALGVPYVLRRLGPDRVMQTFVEVFQAVVLLDPRVLAVAVQDWTDCQSAIRHVIGRFGDTSPEALAWAIKYRAEVHLGGDLTEISDYFQHHGARWDWSPKRIREEHDRWAESMRTERALREANLPAHQVRIDLGDDPKEIVLEAVCCTALTSGGDLIVEGARMQHCIGGSGFAAKLYGGLARYYHLDSHMGQSTVEFVQGAEGTRILQHKARRNATPCPAHSKAAHQLGQLVTVPRRSHHADMAAEMQQRYADQMALNMFGQVQGNQLGQQGHQSPSAMQLLEMMQAQRAYGGSGAAREQYREQLLRLEPNRPADGRALYENYRRTIGWDSTIAPPVNRPRIALDFEDPTT